MLLLPANLPGTGPDAVHIGDRVVVSFQPLEAGLVLPQFVRA